jgi:hypothetical protein
MLFAELSEPSTFHPWQAVADSYNGQRCVSPASHASVLPVWEVMLGAKQITADADARLLARRRMETELVMVIEILCEVGEDRRALIVEEDEGWLVLLFDDNNNSITMREDRCVTEQLFHEKGGHPLGN